MSNIAYVFTDGSSDYKNGYYGSGAVILNSVSDDADILAEISVAGSKPELMKYNNVTGEVLACCYAIEKCISMGIKDVILHVDYIGLIHWYNGSWQARNILSQSYKKVLTEYRKYVNIEFVKVKAHSKVYWNEYVDGLAKTSIKNIKQKEN